MKWKLNLITHWPWKCSTKSSITPLWDCMLMKFHEKKSHLLFDLFTLLIVSIQWVCTHNIVPPLCCRSSLLFAWQIFEAFVTNVAYCCRYHCCLDVNRWLVGTYCDYILKLLLFRWKKMNFRDFFVCIIRYCWLTNFLINKTLKIEKVTY